MAAEMQPADDMGGLSFAGSFCWGFSFHLFGN